MPKTKFQGFIFGIIMSYAMTYGMEVYNITLKEGANLTISSLNSIFLEALKEMTYMGLLVILFSNLWGTRIGAIIASKYCNPERDNPYICRLLRQAGTVIVMCPTMSLVGSILFNIILANVPLSQLPVIWIKTTLKNFPMAFFWSMFVAAPFTHWTFGKIFQNE